MTATATKNRNKRSNFIAQTSGLDLAGMIITWTPGDREHSFKDVVKALEDAGLDNVARTMLPRHAFSRACRKLAEERIIDLVREDDEWIQFQFTRRTLNHDEWEYAKETTLRLNKCTGKIECPIISLETVAQAELDRCMEVRTTTDITRIVQRLFEQEAAKPEATDMFPIRDQGGAYFVPKALFDMVERVRNFLVGLGGSLNRFPVPAGTQTGNASIQEVVFHGLNRLIAEYEAAVKEFGLETRPDTLHRAAERVKTTRVKLEAYANFLGDKKDELCQAVDEWNKHLAERVELLAKAKEADVAADCDHCQAPNPITQGQKKCKCAACGQTFAIEWEEEQEAA